ncbi:serine hydrolase, partial [Symbiobacterium terraclitae]|uniref:serine hydrolase n=1 Tax=Symbiobacterium terraclitae TaxID=557451 RepID=UPI0035B5501B
MAGPRPAFHAFCLITALALVSSLLGTVAAVPAAAPAAPASLGTAVEAEGGGEQPEGGGDSAGAAGGSGGGQGDRPVEASRPGGSGRDEPRAQADSGGSSRPLTGSPQQPPAPQRPPAPCVPKAPLAAAAAAGESLPYAAPPPVEAPVGALAELERALSEFLAGRPGNYGIAVVDLATGATAAVGADQVFVAASTFKVPLVMYVLDLAARGEADLEEQLFYAPEDWEGGTGILHSSVPGDCHTVSELLNLALTVSDNIATNMLLRRFGEENVFAYMRGLGGTVTNLETGRRATTPRDMVRYLERAYRQAAAEGGHHYRILMGLLTQTAFGDRIAAGAPPSVPVAHKIGTLPAMVHDVGIVFLPEHPFAIAIFSAGVNEQAAAADLAQITRLVSEFLSGWVWDGVPE